MKATVCDQRLNCLPCGWEELDFVEDDGTVARCCRLAHEQEQVPEEGVQVPDVIEEVLANIFADLGEVY